MREIKEKCEHVWIPTGYTKDTQVFGTSDEEEVFLEGKGFIMVECDECGETGYCINS
jgi:hypothetical protein